ncbi:hypothetical protein D3C83_184620 [compost metagenome]
MVGVEISEIPPAVFVDDLALAEKGMRALNDVPYVVAVAGMIEGGFSEKPRNRP